jgi:hypothetical protein
MKEPIYKCPVCGQLISKEEYKEWVETEGYCATCDEHFLDQYVENSGMSSENK